MSLTGRPLIVAMCLGQVGNLLPHVTLPATMAQHLMPAWGLSGSQAGLMAASYAFGYMLAVPVLTTLTDRIDARRILFVGSLLSGAATVGLGLFAQGMLSAMLFWGLAGVGFAGAYMPGLKALTDRLGPADSRAVTFYTSSYSFGVGLSFLAAQVIADWIGWRAAFLATGLGPLAMIAACFLMAPYTPPPANKKLLDFRPVIRNRPAMGYVLGYGAHCFELYGMRTWIVAFWTFVVAHNAGDALLSPVAVSVLVTLLAMPASIFGNEAAIRFGRHRALTAVMVASAVLVLALGFLATKSPWLVLALVLLHAVSLNGDSGALTSGMSASAHPTSRGATLALHSTVGFGMSAVGAWATGAALDAAGGPMSASGWTAAFALLSFSILLGPLALWWSRRSPSADTGQPTAT
jgi:predicted MFS family arabinose efflux permease